MEAREVDSSCLFLIRIKIITELGSLCFYYLSTFIYFFLHLYHSEYISFRYGHYWSQYKTDILVKTMETCGDRGCQKYPECNGLLTGFRQIMTRLLATSIIMMHWLLSLLLAKYVYVVETGKRNRNMIVSYAAHSNDIRRIKKIIYFLFCWHDLSDRGMDGE